MSRTFHRFTIIPAILLAGWAAWGMLDSAFGQPPASHPASADQSPERERAGQVTAAVADDFDLDAFIQSLNPPTVEEIIQSLEPIPTLEECLTPLPDDPNMPFRRALTGEDKARVEELDRQTEELQKNGKWAGAVPLACERAETRAREQGSEHWQTVDAWWEAETLKAMVGMPADPQAELAQASAANPLLLQLHARGNYREARDVGQRQLQTYIQHLGTEHPLVANCLSNLGMILHDQGRFPQAISLCREAFAQNRKLLGDGHPEVATSLDNLAGLVYAEGRLREAELLCREALARRRRLLGDDDLDVARSLHNLAGYLEAQGRGVEAEPLSRRALALWRRRLGDARPDVAKSLFTLGDLLVGQGRLAEAEPLFREALALYRRVLGDAHPDVGQGLHNLASLLRQQGRLAEAEALYREALALGRTVLPQDHPGLAHSLNGLAALLKAQDRPAEAESLVREALALGRSHLSDNHPDVCACRHNLALLLHDQGRLAEAEPLLRQALTGWREALGNEHPLVGTGLHNLALLLRDQGQLAEAEALLRDGLAILRRVSGDKHPYVAITLTDLAALLDSKGDYTGAEAAFAEAADAFEAARLRISAGGLERTPFAAESSPLGRFAAVLARNGKPAFAWQRLEQNLARGLLDTVSARASRPLPGAERSQEESLLGQLAKLDERLSALAGMKEPSDEAHAAGRELRNEREALQAQLARFEKNMEDKYGVTGGKVYGLEAIQAHLPADTALLAWADVKGEPHAVDPNGEHWACVVRQVGEPVWVALPGSGADGAWTEEDDKLPQQVRHALSQRNSGKAQESQELVRRLHVQRIRPLEAHLQSAAETLPVRHLIVLSGGWMAGLPVEVLTDEYAVSYAPSGTMYAWLTERRHEGTQAHKDEGVGTLLALGDPVFAQPEAVAEATPEVPDHGVLIAMVLPDSNAGRSGLKAGDVLVSYAAQELGSAAELGPAIQKAATAGTTRGDEAIPVRVWREGRTLELAVAPGKLGVQANPQPPAEALAAKRRLDAALAGTRGASLAPLPGSRCEVDAIATLFKQAPGAAESTVLLGSDASEQRLDELAATGELQKFRFLHLATHAVMDDQVAMRSALILSQDRLPDALQQVLAGKEVWDGRLTADQIVRTWKLDAELVTLSACQTALGKASGGEGYLGFAQALFVVGAHSLVLSLWKVDDTATALVMQRFYKNLLGVRDEGTKGRRDEGKTTSTISKAEALREAKNWLRHLTADEVSVLTAQLPGGEVRGTVREKPAAEELPAGDHPYASPYYWAAFILVGDPG